MRRRWLLGAAALVAVTTAVVTWRAWPRDPGPVAPHLTAAEAHYATRQLHAQVTPLPGGSASEAHRLWERYRTTLRNPDGTRPSHVHISLMQVSRSGGLWPTGDYWVVYAENVYNPCLGLCAGMSDEYGRAIDLYRPGSLQAAGSIDG